ncbi:MAG: MBL fold metallo-hydrolase [Anaerolineae bacterium]
MLEGIHWLGHASFRIELGGMIVYIDPWKLTHPMPADLVLVTHDHHDHLSPADIHKIQKSTTTILYAGKSSPEVNGHTRLVVPGEKITVGAATIETVPAYNLVKTFHPRVNNFVGYILELGGQRIYHAGDTDAIPEMSAIRCDVALLPIGGKYTMDVPEALRALDIIKPKIAVPIHYGDIIGSQDDGLNFQKGAPRGITVVLLKKE